MAAAAGLPPCRWWQRLGLSLGIAHACNPGRPATPARRVLVLGAVGLGALVLGTFLAGDDDSDDEE